MSTASQVTDSPMSRDAVVSIAVGGMTCGACAAKIERRLNVLDGVSASVNYASERARVALPVDLPVERLVDEIRSAGYTAELVQDTAQFRGPPDEVDQRLRSLRRRLIVSALLFMPLCDLSIAFSLVPSLRFPHWQWLLIVLAAPVLTWAAWPFYTAAVRNARHRTSTMDTLVSLGIVAATGWSLYAMFWRDTDNAPRSWVFVLVHQSGGAIYLDVAAGVTTFLLAGRYFEALVKRRTGDALRSLAAVGAKDVAVLDAMDGSAGSRWPSSRSATGSWCGRGRRWPPTARSIFGESADRSQRHDRRVPARRRRSRATGWWGARSSVGGRLVVRATSVGRDTQLAHMVRLVEDAQNEKAAVQRLADRISGVFVPVVLVIALATLVGWLLAGGSSEQAFSAALSVLIIACPCALGLATPTALLVASGAGARQGIFFKGYQALEASRQVDTVVLDKTGTVTEGRMAVTDIEGVARRRACRAPALGRGARTGVRAPGGAGHHRRRRRRVGQPASGRRVRGPARARRPGNGRRS